MRRALSSVALLFAVGTSPAAAQSWPSPFGPGARIAMNDNGEAVIAWRTENAVFAAVGTANGFATPSKLAAVNESFAAPEVGIDNAGNALVVWETAMALPEACYRCGARSVSTGVWFARRPGGGGFGTPQALAGTLSVIDKRADPHLAVRPNGRVAVVWSDAEGTVAATPGAQPRRLAGAQFAASSLAVSDAGELVAGDNQGQLVTCPPAGACAPPRRLPSSPSGYADVHVASNGAGKLVAAYPDADGLRVTQRPPAGDWSVPVVIETTNPFKGAGLRGVAVAEDGTADVVWLTSGDPRKGEYTLLHEGHWSDPGAIRSSLAGPYGEDVQNARLAVNAGGDAAFAWGSYDARNPFFGAATAKLAIRRHDALTAGPSATLTPVGATHASGDTPDVALNARGEVLAAWTDLAGGVARLQTRWLATDGARPVRTLASATLPPFPAPITHAAIVYGSTGRPSARGTVAVVLRCVSLDQTPCIGRLTLSRAGRRIGRAHFRIAALQNRSVSVRLSRATLRSLARHRRLLIRAKPVTPGGSAVPSTPLTLRRR